MEVQNENDKKRVGIYTQKSVEATATGDGLAPQGDKSPVARTDESENVTNVSKTIDTDENEGIEVIEITSETVDEKPESTHPPDQDVSETDQVVNDTSNQPDTNSPQETTDSVEPNLNLDQNAVPSEPDKHDIDERDNNRASDSSHCTDRNSRNSSCSNRNSDGNSEPIVYELTRPIANIMAGIKRLPRSEHFYGKDRWIKSIETLRQIGYLPWEINVMLQCLDDLAAEEPLESRTDKKAKRKMQFLESQKAAKQAKVDNEHNPFKTNKIPEANKPPGIYTITIANRLHPKKHISPEIQVKMLDKLNALLEHEQKKPNNVISMHFYYDGIVYVRCKNYETVKWFISKLEVLKSGLPPMELILTARMIEVRKRVRVFIPYTGFDTPEILDIIGKQNRIITDAWEVYGRTDLDDGVELDVEMNESIVVGLFTFHAELHFLLDRCLVRAVNNDDGSGSAVAASEGVESME